MAVVRLDKNTFDLRVNLLSTSHTCSFMVYQYVRSEFFYPFDLKVISYVAQKNMRAPLKRNKS